MQRNGRRGGVVRLLGSTASLLAVVLLGAACTVADTSSDNAGSKETIKIGMIADMSGVQKTIGLAQRNAFQIYLDRNGGKLGGHKVELVVEDESDNPKSAAKAIDGLMSRDDLLSIIGIHDVRTAAAIYPKLQTKRIPTLDTLACLEPVPDNVRYMWCIPHLTSYHAASLGAYVADQVGDGSVYVLGADLGPGAPATTMGFIKTFKAAGGQIANLEGDAAYAPYTEKVTYQPYLDEAVESGADAIYVWATGVQAIRFVQEYRKHKEASKIPVYASGALTCCGMLGLQGEAALGIYTGLDYAADLDNQANREFVVAYQEKYGSVPTEPAAFAYGSAMVLDKAIRDVEASGDELTGTSLERAIDDIGVIEGPRGSWAFDDKHVAISRFYLRQVQWDGSVLANVFITELTTPGLLVE